MKEIAFYKDGNGYIFNFYFKHSAHILMSVLGGTMVFTFALLYMLKPYVTMNDEGFFLLAFFIASVLSMHMYRKYRWLSVRKKLVIAEDNISFYYDSALIKSLPASEVTGISQVIERVLIFPFISIVIEGKDDKINIIGFKHGKELDQTKAKLEEIILQENQG